MKKTISLLAFISLMTGCANFHTTQTDLSYDPETKQERKIITKVSATTFLTAKSDLAKFKASQTDKTQSAAVGSLGQATDGTGLTNVASLVEAVASGVVKGLVAKP